MEENYKIDDVPLGKNKHSYVYIIQGLFSQKEFIVKIYDNSRIIYYNNETNILRLLHQRYANKKEVDFFLMFNNMQYNPNMFPIPKEIFGFNNQFLFYDYLPNLSLFDYISQVGKKINENHAKFLCYKLLESIEKLHAINICHNKLDISNIMFDNDFNLKIIHFSEAKIINNEKNKYVMNKDLFGLGQILAKIVTFGNLVLLLIIKIKKFMKFFITLKQLKLFMRKNPNFGKC